jgi:hypothetical protein
VLVLVQVWHVEQHVMVVHVHGQSMPCGCGGSAPAKRATPRAVLHGNRVALPMLKARNHELSRQSSILFWYARVSQSWLGKVVTAW